MEATPIVIGRALKGPIRKRVRKMGLRRSRSIGLRKTHLGHVAVAAAINVIHDHDLGYVFGHSLVAGKTGISAEEKQNVKRAK